MKTTYVYPRDAEELKQLRFKTFKVDGLSCLLLGIQDKYIFLYSGGQTLELAHATLELLDEPESKPNNLGGWHDGFTTLTDEPKPVKPRAEPQPEPLTTDQRIAYLRCLVDYYDSLSEANRALTLTDDVGLKALNRTADEINSLRRQINPEFFKDV